MSDFLRNARNFSIGDHATFNNVQGDQHQYNNHYHATNRNTTIVKRKPLWTWPWRSKDSEYDQYEEVKRGDVEIIREVCSHRLPGQWDCIRGRYRQRGSKCTKTVSAGQIVGMGGPRMTIVSYEGPEAQKEWKRDFTQCSSTLRAKNAHLLAINQSRIPLLIFTSELIPAAQFLANVGPLGRMYASALMASTRIIEWKGMLTNHLQFPGRLDCLWTELWMDLQRGVLCCGPEGPGDGWHAGAFYLGKSVDAPPTTELLREDICTRFLTGLKSKEVDCNVVRGLSYAYSDRSVIEVVDKSHPRSRFWEPVVDHFTVIQPKVVSTLTNTPVAVGTRALDWSGGRILHERRLLANGMTRFTLQDKDCNLQITLDTGVELAWLSQASSVFRACEVSLEEDDPSDYTFIMPQLELKGLFSKSKFKRQRRHQRPLFLFVHPPPSSPIKTCSTITSLHYWSFDEDGQDPLSNKKCRRLGLPVALTIDRMFYNTRSWPREVYGAIHDYQSARGFDPTTPEFARSLGFQIYTIPDDSNRFEGTDVAEELETLSILKRKDQVRRRQSGE